MAPAAKPTTETRMREVAEVTFKAWNDHDVDTILDYLTDDIVWSDPTLVGPLRGKADVARDLNARFAAFPDLHFAEDDFHVFYDVKLGQCLVTWTLTGTMTGFFETTGIPATGKHARTSGVLACSFRDGFVSEYTNHWDALDFLQQLGLLPKTDGLAFKSLVMADLFAVKAEDLAGRARKVLQR